MLPIARLHAPLKMCVHALQRLQGHEPVAVHEIIGEIIGDDLCQIFVEKKALEG